MTCTSCKLPKKIFKQAQITQMYRTEPFYNGLCMTPPMGWNSWNYFKENINHRMLVKMAEAIRESGLLEAGYSYLNLDDYWEADRRDEEGKLICDYVKFPKGMDGFVKEINALGFKVGIYSSNGTLTCQSLPASFKNEYNDACQFVRWGIEYLKYDYCYHKMYSQKGPELFGISVTPLGTDAEQYIPAKNAALSGTAKLVLGACHHHPNHGAKKEFIKGLDANRGLAKFLFQAPKKGKYVVSLDLRYPCPHTTEKETVSAVRVNEGKIVLLDPGFFNKPCRVAPVRVIVDMTEGNNFIDIFNPIGNVADSTFLQYAAMSDALLRAVEKVSEEKGERQKPVAYSLCCWGNSSPHEWGYTISNLWRTTGDIGWTWKSIMDLYEKNVILYKYASPGHWNDPDMLEVGNGDLTIDENRAHFALWCMMASPLLLGNDVTNMKPEHLAILKNKNLIAVDQDALGKQAKRILRSKKALDVLVRPLADGAIALCVLNKAKKPLPFEFSLADLQKEEYVKDVAKESYTAIDLWEETTQENVTKLSATVPAHGVLIWKLQ